MKAEFKGKDLNIFGNMLQIKLPLSELSSLTSINDDRNAEKVYAMEIKRKSKKRSLDANAFLWSVLADMADKLHTTKDELYLEMLSRYGVFTYVIVKPSVVERVKHEWRTVRELGEVTVNGQTGIQLQCYFGSSTYNSKEFSVLLNGVLDEAREMGLEYISEADKNLMLQEWGK